MPTDANPFAAVRVQGGLLPRDLLDRIATGDSALRDLTAESYACPPQTRFKDHIATVWGRVRGYWRGFQAARQKARESGAPDLDVTRTREQWLLPLLDELGYGRPEYRAAPEVIDGRSFSISHRAYGVPLHLVSASLDLDEAVTTTGGRRKVSPFTLLQEYLNVVTPLWGIVANGRRLRLVRDNLSLIRVAYVEFDLEAMLEDDLYSDFVLAFLLLHRTRLAPTPERPGGILEHWRDQAETRGERALAELRKGVEEAIRVLGEGLARHPANHQLRKDLHNGSISAETYYNELLRVVYRLLFLLVAESRDLLFPDPPENPDPLAPKQPEDYRRDRQRYYDYYSLSRLIPRLRALQRDTRYDDVWRGVTLVFDLLGGRSVPAPAPAPHQVPWLGLTPLGGVFSPSATEHLRDAMLFNSDFAEALYHLTTFAPRGEGRRRRVDYANLNTEELGSVYESLLEKIPSIATEASVTRLVFASSNQRKETGSYYTPDSLVQELIKSALDPVIADRQRAAGPSRAAREQAILGMTVCDPACGSGHFLLAAARRLATELATIRADDRAPTQPEYRRALREVIRQCVFGVDSNPMAVELCKVALWMEAHDPGSALTFLDASIRCGDSLVGARPDLIAAGVPDGAFDPVTGDDNEVAKTVKKRNRAAREQWQAAFKRDGGVQLAFFARADDGAAIAQRFQAMLAVPEDDLAAAQAKAQAFHQLRQAMRSDEDLATLWTAAFFTPITAETATPLDWVSGQTLIPTNHALLDYLRGSLDARVAAHAQALAQRHRFFHWRLAFPHIFREERGGFDCVLSNPPWEQIETDPEEFFDGKHQPIVDAPNLAARQPLINQLRTTNPSLWEQWREHTERIARFQRFLHRSGRFPLTTRGRLNFAPLFTEMARSLIARAGRAGVIVPTGIATNDSTKQFFQALRRDQRLVSLYGFQNRESLFEAIGDLQMFCLLTIAGETVGEGQFAFFLTSTEQLRDPVRRFTLTPDDFRLLNPNTGTAPIFRTRPDADLTKAIYRRAPVLINETDPEHGNPWDMSFQLMFMMNTDSYRFRTRDQLISEGWRLIGNVFHKGGARCLPLYEAKLFHQFNHRWATFTDDNKTRDLTPQELADPTVRILPRYWVPESDVQAKLAGRWDRDWLLGWRDIARATDERTMIATVFPRGGVGHKFLLMMPNQRPTHCAVLLACVNSLVFDYTTRQKLGGTDLTYTYFKQLPVLPPSAYREEDLAYIAPRVLELVYTTDELAPFARDLGYHGPPFRWDEERRATLRAELDAYYAGLYGLTRKQLRYILDPHDLTDAELEDILNPWEDSPTAPRTTTFPGETFRVLKNAEIQAYGEFRTKRLALAAWERLGYGQRGPQGG